MLQNETSQRHMHHEKELSQQTMVLEAEKRDLAEKIASLEKTLRHRKQQLSDVTAELNYERARLEARPTMNNASVKQQDGINMT